MVIVPAKTFILTSYFLYTQVMLILILINVQYLQNVLFSFEKSLNGQIHSPLDSHHQIKKVLSPHPFPSTGGNSSPLTLNTIWITLNRIKTVAKTMTLLIVLITSYNFYKKETKLVLYCIIQRVILLGLALLYRYQPLTLENILSSVLLLLL